MPASSAPLMTVIAGAILVSLPIVIGLYAYVVYPALLRVVAARRPASGSPNAGGGFAPLVTIVIPAYNEEHQIRGAIEAVLAQDYPAERRQTLVLSDASSDRTDDIVREYATRGVELLRMPVRGGKTAAENASVTHIRGEIVINTDSSVRLHPAAVRLLVNGLADPSVGVASTRDVSVTSTASVNQAEGGYVNYEMGIRLLETRSGGIVGASGSGYAIRTNLHRGRVREDLSRDFSAALTAQRHGFRAISVEDALCYVPRSLSLDREYRRKVRTISRGMETLYVNRDLLNPFRHGAFAWKLFSHKVSRWLVSLAALPALLGLVLFSTAYPWSSVLLVGAVSCAALAVAGATWPETRPIPRWLPVGILGALAANLAVVHSAWRFVHGHEDHVWEPTRRAAISAQP
jgi:cellulose synthase/poly-beta-1,6-N-acetylglucosamine synthase-like glycosyltransferase